MACPKTKTNERNHQASQLRVHGPRQEGLLTPRAVVRGGGSFRRRGPRVSSLDARLDCLLHRPHSNDLNLFSFAAVLQGLSGLSLVRLGDHHPGDPDLPGGPHLLGHPAHREHRAVKRDLPRHRRVSPAKLPQSPRQERYRESVYGSAKRKYDGERGGWGGDWQNLTLPWKHEVRATAMVTPALGPSLGTDPAGRCTWTSSLVAALLALLGVDAVSWDRDHVSAIWALSSRTSPSWPVSVSLPTLPLSAPSASTPAAATAVRDIEQHSTSCTVPTPEEVHASPAATPGVCMRLARCLLDVDATLGSPKTLLTSSCPTSKVSVPFASFLAAPLAFLSASRATLVAICLQIEARQRSSCLTPASLVYDSATCSTTSGFSSEISNSPSTRPPARPCLESALGQRCLTPIAAFSCGVYA
mmetsp:Transcript_4365/g.15652  ORF Transcript_4365/g.15652 Transcript_4365/m.15652 type:complete len:415 (-) Transcript_4365:1961-3205(-)